MNNKPLRADKSALGFFFMRASGGRETALTGSQSGRPAPISEGPLPTVREGATGMASLSFSPLPRPGFHNAAESVPTFAEGASL